MTEEETIGPIVSSGLCTGCGTCVSICPTGAIHMVETTAGFLRAQIESELCNFCGLCAKSCPGSHLEPGILTDETDPFTGPVLAAYCGYTTDPDIRRTAQSGGIVTALLRYLLAVGQINGALVTRMPEDGSLRPLSFLAKNQEELRQAQGSKYCPIAANTALQRTFGEDDSIAVVGLPCHIHGIRNVQEHNKIWRKHIPLTIGLFCDRTLSFAAIDYLIDKANLTPDEVKSFQFRNTERTGWPGNVYIKDKKEGHHDVPSKYRRMCKDACTSARCRLCFDKMNILSDIAVGDAWGIREGEKGYSAILARTQRGLDVLESAEEAGHIDLEKVSAEDVFRGQGIDKKRIQWAAYNSAWKRRGGVAPSNHLTELYQRGSETDAGLEPYLEQLDWAEGIATENDRVEIARLIKRNVRDKDLKSQSFLGRIGKTIIHRVFPNRSNT